MLKEDVSLFIFHRDLRLADNTSLIALIEKGYPVIPVFVFSPEQINKRLNSYFSNPAVQFMCESLEDLSQNLEKLETKLHVFEGNTLTTIKNIVKTSPINVRAIAWNEDYSVYAKERDQSIASWCKTKDIEVITKEDYGLLGISEGILPSLKPYTVFSPFYNKVLSESEHQVRPVNTFRFVKAHFFEIKAPSLPLDKYYTPLSTIAVHGGRSHGVKVLDRIRKKEYTNYQEERNRPDLQKTTMASPHLKFGTISIREMWHAIVATHGKSHGLLRELVFRDFYLKIYAHDGRLQRGRAMRYELDKALPWKYDKALFTAWCEGRTGYPLVDAGMRELNTTGHQHNRIRMLCSSVLTKYFLIDWRWGMKYYYQHLVDADVFSNTAGWGFASSTGADAVPYFRAPFNPFIQSKKFDPQAVYIKRWIPELANVEPSDIHSWFDPVKREKYMNASNFTYPAPILDHQEASRRAVAIFREAGKPKILSVIN